MADMLQPPNPAPNLAAGLPDVAALAVRGDDEDLALGWECAAPALQIERWAQEAAGFQGEAH